MRILSIDAATRLGWCFGDSRERGPAVFKAVRLCKADQDGEEASYNVGPWLRDRLREFKPEALVVEDKLNLAAQKSQQAGAMQHLLHGGINATAAMFGLQVHKPAVGSIRTFMCGRRSGVVTAAEIEGLSKGQKSTLQRKRTKEMVLTRCHQLGLLPVDCDDFDIADAALQWGYWASRYGQRSETELHLFSD